MGRQLFQDGPYVDPPVAAVAAYTTVTIAPMWPAATFTPIFANDPKAGKIYSIKAGGIVTMSVNTCTMLITPKYGTGGIALGPSPAQLLPIMTNIPWYLQADLVFRTIGNPGGANSTCVLSGFLAMQGTIATPGAGTIIPFGSTASVSVDASANANVEFNTTLGGTTGAPSIQTLWAYIFSRN
jgi:hypothetical protein